MGKCQIKDPAEPKDICIIAACFDSQIRRAKLYDPIDDDYWLEGFVNCQSIRAPFYYFGENLVIDGVDIEPYPNGIIYHGGFKYE